MKQIEITTEKQERGWIRRVTVNGEQVSWHSIRQYTIRIGAASLRMGGIGAVNTEPKHRMKGYMRRLLEDSVNFMMARGFDVSMLFGISDFYQKFGYEVCLPEYRLTVPTRDAELAGKSPCCSRHRIRQARRRDFRRICELHNRLNLRWPCTALMNPAEIKNFPMGSNYWAKALSLVLTDKPGRTVGYAAVDKHDTEVNVAEAAAEGTEAFYPLMRRLAQMAVEKRTAHITIFAPPDHPFAEFARKFGGQMTTQYHRAGGGMIRIINQQRLFQGLKKELTKRTKQRPECRHGSLLIVTELGRVQLQVSRNGVQLRQRTGRAKNTLRLPQAKLAQLIAGRRTMQDLLADEDVKARGKAAEIGEILSPTLEPYFWTPDRF